jgi:CubicO group peptidase (beta-lactamase class C family)
LDRAASEGVFPGGVLVHGRPAGDPPPAGLPERPDGPVRTLWTGLKGLTRCRVPVGPDTVYDLASLTKVVATTTLMMISVDRGLIGLSTPVTDLIDRLGLDGGRLGPDGGRPGLDGGRLGPDGGPDQAPDGGRWRLPGDWRRLTALDLLAHRSGLPAWRPYHLMDRPLDAPRLASAILGERPLFGAGERTLYGDPNFILLGLWLEAVWGAPLAGLFRDLVAKPLGLERTGFNPPGSDQAPTEDGHRIGGPLDWPGAPILGPVPAGRVHDDNAAAMGGAAGHAGLFGTAPEIWMVLRDWALAWAGRPGALAGTSVVREFATLRPARTGPGRAAGFDAGQGVLAGALGHLGYTGGCLWWDPARDKGFVFLCNRVHPTARGSKIAGFRQALAETLWGGA